MIELHRNEINRFRFQVNYAYNGVFHVVQHYCWSSFVRCGRIFKLSHLHPPPACCQQEAEPRNKINENFICKPGGNYIWEMVKFSVPYPHTRSF